MTRLAPSFSTAIPRPDRRPLLPAARPAPRERAFGIGYGASSGYGSDRRYARAWSTPGFRFR